MTTIYKLSNNQTLNILSNEKDNNNNIIITFKKEKKNGYIRNGRKPTGRPIGSKNRKSKNIHSADYKPSDDEIKEWLLTNQKNTLDNYVWK